MRTRGRVEHGDPIGDDTLQKQSRGQVVPDAFTHGTSQQRVRWFTQGFRSGRIDACDTEGAIGFCTLTQGGIEAVEYFYPGGGVTGLPGHNAARAMLAQR